MRSSGKDKYMNKTWELTVKKMNRLRDSYDAGRSSERTSVHKTLVLRSAGLLFSLIPEAQEIYAPLMNTLTANVCRPDEKGDAEKGMGKHYYCACESSGKRLTPVCGYYKNGLGRFSRSARTMMEEDYTMALTFRNAGSISQGGVALARAIHMLSDMCCLPHASKMTYVSNMRNIHKAYEELAEAVYPDFVPVQQITESDLRLFDDRVSFEAPLNSIAEKAAGELGRLIDDPLDAIMSRLYETERAVAALLYRYSEDIFLSPDDAHYIAPGMKLKLYGGDTLTADVTDKGVVLRSGDEIFTIDDAKNRRISVFSAAHRHDGEFTLSPAGDREGNVLSGKKLSSFDPRNNSQLIIPEQSADL